MSLLFLSRSSFANLRAVLVRCRPAVWPVVQQRGLFNDPVAEINSLVHVIKQEMQDLNAELDASQVRDLFLIFLGLVCLHAFFLVFGFFLSQESSG